MTSCNNLYLCVDAKTYMFICSCCVRRCCCEHPVQYCEPLERVHSPAWIVDTQKILIAAISVFSHQILIAYLHGIICRPLSREVSQALILVIAAVQPPVDESFT